MPNEEEAKRIASELGLGSYEHIKRSKPNGGRDIRKSANEKKRLMNRTDEREDRILELRRKGLSFRQIADAVGMTVGACHTAFKRVMERNYEVTREAALAHREEQLHQLDEQMKLLLEQQETDFGNLKIVDRILKVQERKAKLLGLDAVIKTETTVTSMSHEQALDLLDENKNVE